MCFADCLNSKAITSNWNDLDYDFNDGANFELALIRYSLQSNYLVIKNYFGKSNEPPLQKISLPYSKKTADLFTNSKIPTFMNLT